jgi:hypothetical protein
LSLSRCYRVGPHRLHSYCHKMPAAVTRPNRSSGSGPIASHPLGLPLRRYFAHSGHASEAANVTAPLHRGDRTVTPTSQCFCKSSGLPTAGETGAAAISAGSGRGAWGARLGQRRTPRRQSHLCRKGQRQSNHLLAAGLLQDGCKGPSHRIRSTQKVRERGRGRDRSPLRARPAPVAADGAG